MQQLLLWAGLAAVRVMRLYLLLLGNFVWAADCALRVLGRRVVACWARVPARRGWDVCASYLVLPAVGTCTALICSGARCLRRWRRSTARTWQPDLTFLYNAIAASPTRAALVFNCVRAAVVIVLCALLYACWDILSAINRGLPESCIRIARVDAAQKYVRAPLSVVADVALRGARRLAQSVAMVFTTCATAVAGAGALAVSVLSSPLQPLLLRCAAGLKSWSPSARRVGGRPVVRVHVSITADDLSCTTDDSTSAPIEASGVDATSASQLAASSVDSDGSDWRVVSRFGFVVSDVIEDARHEPVVCGTSLLFCDCSSCVPPPRGPPDDKSSAHTAPACPAQPSCPFDASTAASGAQPSVFVPSACPTQPQCPLVNSTSTGGLTPPTVGFGTTLGPMVLDCILLGLCAAALPLSCSALVCNAHPGVCSRLAQLSILHYASMACSLISLRHWATVFLSHANCNFVIASAGASSYPVVLWICRVRSLLLVLCTSICCCGLVFDAHADVGWGLVHLCSLLHCISTTCTFLRLRGCFDASVAFVTCLLKHVLLKVACLISTVLINVACILNNVRLNWRHWAVVFRRRTHAAALCAWAAVQDAVAEVDALSKPDFKHHRLDRMARDYKQQHRLGLDRIARVTAATSLPTCDRLLVFMLATLLSLAVLFLLGKFIVVFVLGASPPLPALLPHVLSGCSLWRLACLAPFAHPPPLVRRVARCCVVEQRHKDPLSSLLQQTGMHHWWHLRRRRYSLTSCAGRMCRH